MTMSGRSMVCVQYGCGHQVANGWLNFDASPTLVLERIPLLGRLINKNQQRFPAGVRYGDIVKGLPVADGCCQLVYCSHVLEHLPLDGFRMALRNTYRILSPGGVFRCVLPDLEFSIRQYCKSNSADKAMAFLRETGLGQEAPEKGLYGLLKSFLGNSRHLWMWDYASFRRELEAAGFVGVRRAEYGDSQDLAFESVELSSRWVNCLGVECKKPG